MRSSRARRARPRRARPWKRRCRLSTIRAWATPLDRGRRPCAPRTTTCCSIWPRAPPSRRSFPRTAQFPRTAHDLPATSLEARRPLQRCNRTTAIASPQCGRNMLLRSAVTGAGRAPTQTSFRLWSHSSATSPTRRRPLSATASQIRCRSSTQFCSNGGPSQRPGSWRSKASPTSTPNGASATSSPRFAWSPRYPFCNCLGARRRPHAGTNLATVGI
mmetsp:Transcript_2850/g.8435  ORF Transcript_2850/g.8435 Transcript_2850/m.8435 type:complete len:217 (+) Transcript_2850:626-1276(+)